MHVPFALLDDCDATTDHPTSRLHTGLVRVLTCRQPDQFDALLRDMQEGLQAGLHAVGLFDYEQGAQFHGMTAPASDRPLSTILLFAQCVRLSAEDTAAWLADYAASASDAAGPDATAEQQCAGVADVSASVDEAAFNAAIARIHAYLDAGDTYQVNYTYRLTCVSYGSLAALYRKLRTRQRVPFGALIGLPDGGAVLSFSPELFLRHENGLLTARPMKGTAPASGVRATDEPAATALAQDTKNRAENLMIVDMLRNDLGRVAALGTVRVPRLFDVDTYGSVLQMTSTIEARLRPDVTLADIFPALYPCGSITGAPKRRTMQIIDELEGSPRGLYTGAIGWFEQPRAGHRVGDFCLSVPIRTLVLGAEREDGTRRGEMGVGAGIVHDSVAATEYEECRIKAGFLVDAPTDFDLFETIHATREAGYRHLDLHLQRMRTSAACLGFRFDDNHIRATLAAGRDTLAAGVPNRVRLTLHHSGACTVKSAPMAPLPDVVGLLIAPEPVTTARYLLRHKITVRTEYDRAWQAAESQGAFDMLFQNAEGELTEGGRSNLFVMLDGRWYTTPLEAGVLPGIMRGVLLADPAWQASERRLTLDDLARAEKVVVCNALRGVMMARLVG